MPLYFFNKSNNKSLKDKEAFIADIPKKIFNSYNSILCYLRILCRSCFVYFSSNKTTEVKGGVSSGEENKNKGREGFGGKADANTPIKGFEDLPKSEKVYLVNLFKNMNVPKTQVELLKRINESIVNRITYEKSLKTNNQNLQ